MPSVDSSPASHTRAGEIEAVQKFAEGYPVTRDEQWLADEQLMLYDAEQGNVPVRQFKCTGCHCVNSYIATHERAEEIMSTGRRMHHRPDCINRDCYCHTALGPPKEIKTRIVDWGDIPF